MHRPSKRASRQKCKGPTFPALSPPQTSKFITDFVKKNDIANVPRPDNEFLGFVSNILSYDENEIERIGPLIAGVLLGAGWTAGPIMTVTACGGLIGAVFVVLFSVWLSRRRVEGLSAGEAPAKTPVPV